MSNSGGIDLLAQLETDTAAAEARLKDRVDDQLTEKLAALQLEMDKTAEIQDARTRNERERILQRNIEQLRAEAEQEEKDLAQAMFGLNALIEKMGAEYELLTKPSGEAEAVIKRAEQAVKDAEARLGKLQASVPNREARERDIRRIRNWFFIDRRGKARRELEAEISLAQSRVAHAESDVETAKAGIADAQVKAKELTRQRLLNASMDESLQEFQVRAERIRDIMNTRRNKVREELGKVKAQKKHSFEVKEKAAAKVEELDAQLDQREAELKAEEQVLAGLENGSPDHAAQTEKVSDLKAEVEELRGKRNTAHVIFQSKERFALELEAHETTQTKLRDNLTMWISMLTSDTEARIVTFRSRLEAMKALADQEIAKGIDKLGVAIDKDNMSFMATAGAASDRVRMERMEKHPEIYGKLEEIRAAQMEAHARILEREKDALDAFRKQYGIDPLRGSFFTYLGDGGRDGGGAPAPEKPAGDSGKESTLDILGS